MTRKQLNDLLETSLHQRDMARRMIDEHFDELVARGQETAWIKRYLLHKYAVEWLQKQKTDDD